MSRFAVTLAHVDPAEARSSAAETMHAQDADMRRALTLEGVPIAQTRADPRIPVLLQRIRREYREMPGLTLTEAQARRLWDLDGNTCSLVLTTLVAQRFLTRAGGTYRRADQIGRSWRASTSRLMSPQTSRFIRLAFGA